MAIKTIEHENAILFDALTSLVGSTNKAELANMKAVLLSIAIQTAMTSDEKDNVNRSINAIDALLTVIDNKKEMLAAPAVEPAKPAPVECEAAISIIAELISAMHKYEEGTEEFPPFHHRDLMRRAKALVAAKSTLVAWVDVPPGDQDSILYPGYTFAGIKKLPYGKHHLFTASTLDAETRLIVLELLAELDKFFFAGGKQKIEFLSKMLHEKLGVS